jgi:predicted HAD superfamily Cof-like phosphohydrolase
MVNSDFFNKIKKFNEMYGMSGKDSPELPDLKRLEDFKSILHEEVCEIDDIIEKYKKLQEGGIGNKEKIEVMTDLSDWLGDIVVYVVSESRRHGIPIGDVLDVIMDSNFSKLGEDGKAIYDERNKLLKGPNYWRPEDKIRELLKGKFDSFSEEGLESK